MSYIILELSQPNEFYVFLKWRGIQNCAKLRCSSGKSFISLVVFSLRFTSSNAAQDLWNLKQWWSGFYLPKGLKTISSFVLKINFLFCKVNLSTFGLWVYPDSANYCESFRITQSGSATLLTDTSFVDICLSDLRTSLVPHCPKNIMNLRTKTEPVTIEAEV